MDTILPLIVLTLLFELSKFYFTQILIHNSMQYLRDLSFSSSLAEDLNLKNNLKTFVLSCEFADKVWEECYLEHLVAVWYHTSTSLNRKKCLGFGPFRHTFISVPSRTNILPAAINTYANT